MHTRTLTVGFQRSVTADVPNTMEVVVAPLGRPSATFMDSYGDTLLVGGSSTKTILLGNELNIVTFDLVPSDSPELNNRLLYRIAWREQYMGRQYARDFVMPDYDVDFSQLENLGAIIGAEVYLQWSDRSRPGGVAALNDAGQVTDGSGNPVTDEAALEAQRRLDIWIPDVVGQINTVRSYLSSFMRSELDAVYLSTSQQLSSTVASVSESILTERVQRQDAVASLNDALIVLQDSLDSAVSSLAAKADLVDGKILAEQMPAVTFGKAISAANETFMLMLSTDDVNPGDFVIRPEGIWILAGEDPSLLASWRQFRDNASVLSVNGQSGPAIALTAADVGARDASSPVPQDDVTGLTDALNAKAGHASVTTLSERVTDVETDTTLVRKVDGLIPKAALPADAAFITAGNLVAKKDGTVLHFGSGSGTIDIEDVGGLPAALAGKASLAHAHQASDITGLSDTLDGFDTGLYGLEGRVTALEAEGPGGGGAGSGTSTKTSWWSAPAATTNLNTVELRSPFGVNSGGGYYYNPAGAASGEAVYPYLSPNGHLKFVARNESAPADPVYATVTDLAGKASLTHAHQVSDITGLSDALDDKEPIVTAGTTSQYYRGDKSFQTLDRTAVGLSNVDNTSDANKPVSIATQNALTGKAALSHTHALTSITDLTTTLAGKAALDPLTGKVRADQMASLGISDIASLTTTLSTKAELSSSGKLRADQLPPQAITNVVTVTSRAQMLALTSSQVQQGDICILNDTTSDKGSYVLTNADAITLFGSWTKLLTPDSGSVTVNNISPSSGNITLTAADVGARPSTWQPLSSEVTGLSALLAGKVDGSVYSAGLGTKTSPADVQSILTTSSPAKWRADYVDTSGTLTLSGQQIVDGATATVGSVVLLVGQSTATNNGLWTVNSGAWTRTADMPAGSYFLRGSTVIVINGSSNAATIWQQSQNAGLVGSNTNSWTKVLTAGGGSSFNNLTASNGISKVAVLSGGVTTYDLRLDSSVPRKWSGYVTPSAGNFGVVTHNLGTSNVVAWFRDAATRDSVLVGWKPNTDGNTLSVEFDAQIGSTQYWAVVLG